MSTTWSWFLVALVVLGGAGGCSGDRPHGDRSGNDGVGDPAAAEVQALEAVAEQVERDLAAGGPELAALADVLEQRLGPRDVSVLAGNYLAMLESYRTKTPWQPDEDFYLLVDRLRDVPLLTGLPAREAAPPLAPSGPTAWRAALILSNVEPACGFSCEAQGALYALLDLGAGEVKKYYADLLFSGVDCLQDAGKLGTCVAAQTCTWADFTLFVGGCAALTANVALEVTGASKVKTAYVFLKKVLTIWSVGSLTASFADWVAACHDHQATSCPGSLCEGGGRVCLAANGSGATCCPAAQSCFECVGCLTPCGIADCCGLGQRCDAGQCQTCTSGCGPSCCGPVEICANPEQGVCAPCANPCGLTCCPAGTTCLEALHECCAVTCGNGCCADGEACLGSPPRCCASPCGDQCCGPGESCVGVPPRCCAAPCGDECCASGQVCDPATQTCGAAGSCDDAPAIDCAALCDQAIASAQQQCAAMGGTLESTDPTGCIADCRCLLAAIPNLGACLTEPSCPGCEDLPQDMERCGQQQVLCQIPQGGG